MRVVHQAVHDAVGDAGIADLFMPVRDRHLAGENRGTALTQQDRQLQQGLLRRNDLGANAFLLIRHTGMRIGECADLRCDRLHAIGPDQWTIHIPLGARSAETASSPVAPA
jgi:hypothetical protein